MKNEKINPVSLGITIVAVIGLTIWLVIIHHRLTPFVPTPPPAGDISQTTPAPAASTSTATTNPSVCYYLNQPSKGTADNDIEYLKLTVGTGANVTGELGIAYAGKDAMSGTLNGTLSVDPSTSSGYVFTGQYMNTQEGISNATDETIQFDSTHAVVNDGANVSIPRVDCSQYDSLKPVLQD